MSKSRSIRADVLLVQQGLCKSRQEAQALIMAGQVLYEEHRLVKPGTRLPTTALLRLQGRTNPYVSRGGLKLEKALREFDLNTQGIVALDIGSSTGGFTDCLLQHGARHVVAVDVGKGQLAWKLRQDPRVTLLEGVNARYLTPRVLANKLFDLIVIDVSFISLTLILPALPPLLHAEGSIVCLVKPQFEAGRKQVGKGGVVKDPIVHRQVLEKVINTANTLELHPVGLVWSPITGPAGNIEYLIHFRFMQAAPNLRTSGIPDLWSIVTDAHGELKCQKKPKSV